MIVGEHSISKMKFIDREDTINSILRVMNERWLTDRQIGPIGCNDKTYNPLIGVHAVSGGGKSYLIDELVRWGWSKGKSIYSRSIRL